MKDVEDLEMKSQGLAFSGTRLGGAGWGSLGLCVGAVASPCWMQEAVLRRHFPELLAAATSLAVGWLVRLQIQAPDLGMYPYLEMESLKRQLG